MCGGGSVWDSALQLEFGKSERMGSATWEAGLGARGQVSSPSPFTSSCC